MRELAKAGLKRMLRAAGLRLSRIDELEEAIPPQYNASSVLPRVSRSSLKKFLFLWDAVQLVKGVDGTIVECGVAVGHSLMVLATLSELTGNDRVLYGFDSFEGFPLPGAEDASERNLQAGEFAVPPALVSRVFEDAGFSSTYIRQKVRLIKGFFDASLPGFDQDIALLNLDCDLYESYRACLENLYPRLLPGGVVLFDEYEDENFPGAARAIDEFFENRKEKPERHASGKYFAQKPSLAG